LAGLVLPRIENLETRENYGRFRAQPLEKGFAITLGNALRRVMLSYLPGAAVTHVRIDGIQHEFSTIPHVKEDTLELLLNIKAIRLKALSGQPGTLTLDAKGVGEITAGNIKQTTDFDVINPDLYLATIDSSEGSLHIELDIEVNTGFKAAESSVHLPIGTIPLDAIYAPVRKVNFTVRPMHVGRETGNEELTLEIWTDGTITPLNAISRAAEILTEQLSAFKEYSGVAEIKQEEVSHPAISNEKFNMPVEQLDLSVRTMNCLRRAGIATVGELVSKGEKELMSLRNFGQKSKVELEERLGIIGLSLNGEKVDPTEAIANIHDSDVDSEDEE